MAASPVLYVYYPPLNDDSYPGVPNRHITEADWASFTIAQRRTIENATTQEGYTRRKVWVHIDLVDETEEERAQREAEEAAARAEYDRKNSLVRYGQIEAMIDQLEVLPPAEEFAALRQDVDAVADMPPRVEAVEGTVTALASTVSTVQQRTDVLAALRFDPAHPMYGAVRGSVSAAQRTANTTAINLAASDARIAGGVLIIKGEYEVDGTISIASHIQAGDATIRVYSTAISPVIRFGGTTAESTSREGVLPSVVQMAHSKGLGWGSDIGIELRNLISCRLTIPYVEGFGTGIRLTADSGRGAVHNQLTLGKLLNNQVQLDVMPDDAASWTNSNLFIKGDFQHNTSEGTNVPGVRHIRVGVVPSGEATNNNVFLSPSIEGRAPEYHLEIQGDYNVVTAPRFESNEAGNKVRLAGNVNTVEVGSSDGSLVVSGPGLRNRIIQPHTTWIQYGGIRGQGGLTLSNTTSFGDVLTVMASNATPASSTATEYAVKMSANATGYKRETDAFDRIKIDHRAPSIALGSGAAEVDTVLERRSQGDGLTMAAGDMFRVGAVSALPAPHSNRRGYMLRVEGAAGIADGLYICQKTAADTYEWVSLTP